MDVPWTSWNEHVAVVRKNHIRRTHVKPMFTCIGFWPNSVVSLISMCFCVFFFSFWKLNLSTYSKSSKKLFYTKFNFETTLLLYAKWKWRQKFVEFQLFWHQKIFTVLKNSFTYVIRFNKIQLTFAINILEKCSVQIF